MQEMEGGREEGRERGREGGREEGREGGRKEGEMSPSHITCHMVDVVLVLLLAVLYRHTSSPDHT